MLKVRIILIFLFLLPVQSYGQESNEFITVNSLDALPANNYMLVNVVSISGTRSQISAILVNGSLRVSQGDGPWQVVFNDLDDGVYEYSVVAVNAQGESQPPIDFSITVDTTRPELTEPTPAVNTVFTEPISEFSINYVETGSGVGSASFDIRERDTGQSWRCSFTNSSSASNVDPCRAVLDETNNRIIISLSPALPDGRYNVFGSMRDRAGWLSATLFLEYYVNTIGIVPVGTVIGPSNRTLRLSPDVNYSISTNPLIRGSRFPQTSVYINDREVVPLGVGDWNYQFSELDEGEHPLEVRWVDEQGNSSETQLYSVFVDTISPQLTEPTPAVNTVFTEPISEFSINYVETGSGVGSASFDIRERDTGQFWRCSFTNGSSASNVGPCRAVLDETNNRIIISLSPALPDGRYNVFGSMRDKAERRSATLFFEYYVNTTGIVLVGTVTNSSNRALRLSPDVNYFTSANVLIRGSRFPQTSVYINDREVVPLGVGDWNYQFSELGEGEHPLEVRWWMDKVIVLKHSCIQCLWIL